MSDSKEILENFQATLKSLNLKEEFVEKVSCIFLYTKIINIYIYELIFTNGWLSL